jgi:hypothetical protein
MYESNMPGSVRIEETLSTAPSVYGLSAAEATPATETSASAAPSIPRACFLNFIASSPFCVMASFT